MSWWKNDPHQATKWKIFDAMCEDADENFDFTMAEAAKAIDDMFHKLLQMRK